eukprot:836715-Pelagomonas_calceolata.AAC.1
MEPTLPEPSCGLGIARLGLGLVATRQQRAATCSSGGSMGCELAEAAAGPGCGACTGRWWSGVGSDGDGQASRGMDDI